MWQTAFVHQNPTVRIGFNLTQPAMFNAASLCSQTRDHRAGPHCTRPVVEAGVSYRGGRSLPLPVVPVTKQHTVLRAYARERPFPHGGFGPLRASL